MRDDLTGRRFGRWTVLGRSDALDRSGKRRYWDCRCDCGTERPVARESLVRGLSKSCGCLAQELRVQRMMKHGHARRDENGTTKVSKEYRAWANMKTRCTNPNNTHYANYGGRGVTVCKRWLESFEAFLEDMGPAPSPDHSIDRVDPDDGYRPENCRWATRYEQDRNRTDNYFVEYEGKKMTLTDLAEKAGVHRNVLRARLELGLTAEEAVHG